MYADFPVNCLSTPLSTAKGLPDRDKGAAHRPVSAHDLLYINDVHDALA